MNNDVKMAEREEILDGLTQEELKRLALRGVSHLEIDFFRAAFDVRDAFRLAKRLETEGAKPYEFYHLELVRNVLFRNIRGYEGLKKDIQMIGMWNTTYDMLESKTVSAALEYDFSEPKP